MTKSQPFYSHSVRRDLRKPIGLLEAYKDTIWKLHGVDIFSEAPKFREGLTEQERELYFSFIKQNNTVKESGRERLVRAFQNSELVAYAISPDENITRRLNINFWKIWKETWRPFETGRIENQDFLKDDEKIMIDWVIVLEEQAFNKWLIIESKKSSASASESIESLLGKFIYQYTRDGRSKEKKEKVWGCPR